MAEILGVYPRVGGGNSATHSRPSSICGLSPRGRGKLRFRRSFRFWLGSIPAWAGETARRRRNGHISWVYPRVGGGNDYQYQMRGLSWGLSPRGRGKQSISVPGGI